MRVYIFGERTGDTPIKVTTIQLYTDIYGLGKAIIKKWSELRHPQSLEDYINSRWGGSFNVYVNELDSETKPKKVRKSDIWEAMQKEPRLEKEITKALLKARA